MIRTGKLLTLIGLVWCAGLSVAIAAAEPETGKAVGVDPAASAVRDTAVRTLVVGSDVAVGDTLKTGATGAIQLLFDDQTRLALGPNSSLLIETYLLRKDHSVGQFTVDALAGTFRFITGKSRKDAYQIKTPTGVIGVRGTAFDFTVSAAGTTVVLYDGIVHLCDLAHRCVDLTRTCGVGTATDSGSTILAPRDQVRAGLRQHFLYVQSDRPLLPSFRLKHPRDCLPTSLSSPRTAAPPPPTPPLRLRHPRPIVTAPPPVTDPCAELLRRYHGRPIDYLRVMRHGQLVCVVRPKNPGTNADQAPPSLIGNPFRNYPLPPTRPPGNNNGSTGGGIIY